MKNPNLIIAILIISSPILVALIAFPDTFSLSWNQGRGGFLFALAFIIAELVGLKLNIPKKRLFAVIPLAALTIAYIVALEFGLKDAIIQCGEDIQVPLIYSWERLWDYVVMSIFVVPNIPKMK